MWAGPTESSDLGVVMNSPHESEDDEEEVEILSLIGMEAESTVVGLGNDAK